MKKILISVLLVTLLASLMTPIAMAGTVTETILNETFDSGVYTVVTNDDNTVKELYKDGTATGWTFVKTDRVTFADTFPNDDIVANANILSSATNYETAACNDTNALKVGSIANTQLAYNLPEKYTSGVITVSFRTLRQAQQEHIRFRLAQDSVGNEAYTGSSAATFIVQTRSGSKPEVPIGDYNTSAYDYSTTLPTTYVRVGSDSNGGSSARAACRGYNKVVYTIDLDNKKTTATFYYGTNNAKAVTLLDSADGICDNANGVSAIVFDTVAKTYFGGDNQFKATPGALNLDDVVVTHTPSEGETILPTTEVEGFTIADGVATATFNYTQADKEKGVDSKTARIIIASYDSVGALYDVKSGTATVSESDYIKPLSTPAVTIPTGGSVKAFIWDFTTFMPYVVTQ